MEIIQNQDLSYLPQKKRNSFLHILIRMKTIYSYVTYLMQWICEASCRQEGGLAGFLNEATVLQSRKRKVSWRETRNCEFGSKRRENFGKFSNLNSIVIYLVYVEYELVCYVR